MLKKKDLAALLDALPDGVVLVHHFRAEPRLRLTLVRILLLGVIFALLVRAPWAYAVGLSDDELFILPLPRRKDGAGLRSIRREDLTRLVVKRGLIRTKVTVETAGESLHMRVPGVSARGQARDALAALENFSLPAPGVVQQMAQARAAISGEPTGFSAAGPTQDGRPAVQGISSNPRDAAPARLAVLVGDTTGRRYALNALSTSIGRRDTNDIVLLDGEVSGRHACIERSESGHYFVRDLGSTNGTTLNGAALAAASEVRENDVLKLGNTTLFVVNGG